MPFDFAKLRRGPDPTKPPRIVAGGPEGVGKSSWANSAPNPIFIQCEDGLDAINVNAAFPLAISLQDVLDQLGVLITEEHDFKTVVIDTADWLEHLIHKAVAAAHKVESIDQIPYGKGYRPAADECRKVLEGLDLLRNQKRMIVIILAHVKIKRFDDPMTDAYDRYLLDMHDSLSSLLIEWCDVLAFIQHAVAIKTTESGFNQKRNRGVGSGERVLYLEGRPGFIAKNRYGLPASLPFPKDNGWQIFERAMTEARQTAKAELAKPRTIAAE